MPTNLIVNRNGVTYHLDVENTSAILDTDYILVNRDGVTYKAPGDMISKGGSTGAFGSALPPFTSESGPEMTLTNADGKIEFSLDGSSWSTSLNIPPETIYYCIWGSDILSAAHDSNYETLVSVNYPNLSMDQDVEIKLKIDKLPDPFEFTDLIDLGSDTTYTSNTISPLGSINAPTRIWGSSNAVNPQVAIGDGAFQSIPGSPGSLYVNHNTRIRVRHTTGSAALTDYSTTLNIGYGTGAGEFETSTYTTTTLNSVVNKPSITSPSNNDFVDSETFSVTSSAYVSTNAGTHKSSQWQVARDAAFTDIVEQSTSTTDLTSWTPTFGLTFINATGYVRVRHTGSLNDVTSDWSETVEFTPQQWFFWQVAATIRGGAGGGTNGGGGGHAVITVTTTERTFAPTGTFSGVVGNTANGKSGGSGYGQGGNSATCSDYNDSGGGGGSTRLLINGNALAIVGGGGGGAQGYGGGGGGNPGETGGSGGRHTSYPGSSGSGGSPSSGGGRGGDSGCGFHSGNPDRRAPGGGGGGGGNGGNAGSGNTQDQWQTGGGGGGGGGDWNSGDIAVWRNDGWSALSRVKENGLVSIQLRAAPLSAPTGFVDRDSTGKASGGSFSFDVSSLV